MSKNKEKFFEILKDDSYGICPAPTEAQLALYILCDYLLGENFYVAMPLRVEQVNTEIVYTILDRYSREFRKDKKKEYYEYVRTKENKNDQK